MSGLSVRKYDYIDALRGLAIALVVLVHASQQVKPLSQWLQQFMDEGARGVQLFYIASAVTLCMSWAARRATDLHPVRDFYLRRVFRIAPMFYLAIILFLLLNGTHASYFAPNGISWWFVPMTALFLHGLHPETINSVVPGGWSVAVEMTFYLVFPLLMRVRHMGWLLLLLVASLWLQQYNATLSALVFQYEERQKYLIDGFTFFNFIGQFPVFVLGLITYRLLPACAAFGWKGWTLMGGLFLLLLVEFCYPRQAFVEHHVVAGALFALFTLLLSAYPGRWLVNRVTVWLGKLSFSMYLVHIAVLKVLSLWGVGAWFGDGNLKSLCFFVLVLALTAGLSWLTYQRVEKPGIALGRRLIERLESTARPAPQGQESTR
ncbi:acyltransferase [Pantoea sp. Cy-639]|nr:acyltransferase [Pantoea sp. Cy-639]NIF18693.1 acyltransferase [Pantoea sp. Cy-639]